MPCVIFAKVNFLPAHCAWITRHMHLQHVATPSFARGKRDLFFLAESAFCLYGVNMLEVWRETWFLSRSSLILLFYFCWFVDGSCLGGNSGSSFEAWCAIFAARCSYNRGLSAMSCFCHCIWAELLNLNLGFFRVISSLYYFMALESFWIVSCRSRWTQRTKLMVLAGQRYKNNNPRWTTKKR